MSEKTYRVEFDNGAVALVTLDPDIFTDEYLEDWNITFWPSTTEEHIKRLARYSFVNGSSSWDGYGNVRRQGRTISVDINGRDNLLGTASIKHLYSGDEYGGAKIIEWRGE